VPRAKNPEYFYKYEVRCRATGFTKAQALYNFSHELSYQKRWIKGTLTKEEEPTIYHDHEGWIAVGTLFFSKFPDKEGEDESVN
jgi:hypothetical protein